MLSSGRGDAGPILRSTSITMFVVDVEARIFDFDNHYYESEDALTRHQDKALGNRGVRWADIGGRRRLLVGGKINSYIANPTFAPVARPGSLYDWYRGNPRRQKITEAFGELEPIRPEYRDRAARLRVMDKQGVAGLLLFPTLGVGIEEALRDDPDACAKVFHGFNQWLDEDWGYQYEGRMFAAAYIPFLDPQAAVAELRDVLGRGAIVVNVRNAPVPVPGGYRSPFDPAYDGFWELAEEAGVVVATHAGVDGYDAIVQMWEPGRSESPLFRSPLPGVLTTGPAAADFYLPPLCHLLFGRFPGLRLARVGNGANWIPDLLHRLGDAPNRKPGYVPGQPRGAFTEHAWVTPFWEDDVGALVGEGGVDRLLLR